jgi:hypothetical protein
MSSNNDYKILIDAIKYTSEIVLEITNKLTVFEEKFNNLDDRLKKMEKKIIMYRDANRDDVNSVQVSKLLKKNADNSLSNYLLKKDNYNIESDDISFNIKTQNDDTKTNKSINKNINNNDDKKKIDKLIGSIIKRKNELSEVLHNNKEDVDKSTKDKKYSNHEEKSTGEERVVEEEVEEANNITNLKQIRRKTNFAKRF